ncbi:HTH-type transcriptional repressor YvoA [Aliiroseovarius sp. xm-m-379]|uniref:GntR family transcriptional regulator n=1 Tax=Aliiroseovarius TaxID=1658781 RepID=UPI001567CC7B|nr:MULTISPECIES: GntR family transcriptional regulator [Aliiroseovarius]NRP13228.1 HTH-type transcriptional repressor YvoA [Aliiroseovarius sp. xm-d-517]NRP25883.1 HTH-type transcriptional repressor YvoA [Aliiroseovarius sp. xm-m-379]NRP30250.1 HTH-type transcriptional repressor YvoA [Aliiroseovarius sp. xm-m-314]NRP34682.1 HTH-type transcriptional repressor YvoA [Aliiroseovarius sp. xm-a-104]NRP40297.1 HTH-type transcriptional repressor YvoA [Aliiroseovarius sp. xm-m-339-2]
MNADRQSWKEVRDRIRDQILDRTYAPGNKLPRDADLAEQFGCARTTVQRAMQDLSDIGLIERKRKGGTRVRANPVTRATLDIPITRLEVEETGAVYGYQLIDQQVRPTPRDITAKLEQAEPTSMLQVQALHLADHRPYVFEDRWVSIETAPEILDVDLTRESANEWLVRNKPYTRFDLRIYAISADEDTARTLATDPGSALLVIERTTWIGADPITSVRSITLPGYQLLTNS